MLVVDASTRKRLPRADDSRGDGASLPPAIMASACPARWLAAMADGVRAEAQAETTE